MLHFQRLLQIAHDLHGLGPRHLHPLKSLVGGDDLFHFRFDGGEIVVGDRPAGTHVVVEASPDGGAEGELHPFKEPHHSPRHHMRRRMPHHRQRPRIAGIEPFERRCAGGG